MHNCFLSVVSVLDRTETAAQLLAFLQNLHRSLLEAFSDFEIVLVSNHSSINVKSVASLLPQAVREVTTVIKLASPVDINNAWVAGLDRANGDYVVMLSISFAEHTDVVLRLYEEAQKGFDIVYLRDKKPEVRAVRRILYRIFYRVLRFSSKLEIDLQTRIDRIVSRRALNWLLRMRESLRYMKALFSSLGFSVHSIDIDTPREVRVENIYHQLRSAVIVVTSFTTLLPRLLQIGFLTSIVILIGAIADALLVHFYGVNVFGRPQQEVPGLSFLVVVGSLAFMFVCLSLYIQSIYITAMYEEMKQRPLYVVESVQRM